MSARSRGSPKQRQGRRKYGPRRRIPWVPIAAIAVALVGGFFLLRSLEIGAPGERVAVTGVGQHVPEGQPIIYNSVPAVGGPHWPAAAPWGASDAPIPDERAVHNLEHGGVVVSYNAISANDLSKLKALLQTYPRDRYNEVKLLIRPYEAIRPGTFVLAAWGWKQSFDTYDDAAVRAFLDAHLNRCCESVP
jgi:hypothetical protein